LEDSRLITHQRNIKRHFRLILFNDALKIFLLLTIELKDV